MNVQTIYREQLYELPNGQRRFRFSFGLPSEVEGEPRLTPLMDVHTDSGTAPLGAVALVCKQLGGTHLRWNKARTAFTIRSAPAA